MLSMFLAPETAAMEPKLPPVEAPHAWAMPVQASTFAESTDNLYYFILALDVFFFVLVMGAMVYFMVKYRRRSKDQKTSSITHSGKLEFLWSAIPAILLVIIFIWAEVDYVRQSVPPQDAMQIRVVGRKWFWTVEYPDYPGVTLTSNIEEPTVTMMVPKGRPVQLLLTSEDVIHSFYAPAFRIKRDAVPGRYNSIWFEATRTGDYNLFCAEYCGDWHSKMTGVIRVLEPEEFEAAVLEAGRLEQKEGETPEQFGERIYASRGCNACHSVDGAAGTGPTWKGIWGRTENLVDGTITIDGAEGMNYIRESILEPNARIVAGYVGVNMPSYAGQLNDEQIDALIAYMKTLQ